MIDLTYDEEEDESDKVTTAAGDKIPLSFLYRKYNLNILQSDNTQFIELISKAWHATGYYYYYLSSYESSNQIILQNNISLVLKSYKNCLIVNSTGNVLYLFSYALALANSGSLKPALKLCKFILKNSQNRSRRGICWYYCCLVLIMTTVMSLNPLQIILA